MKLLLTVLAVVALSTADETALLKIFNEANNQFTAKLFPSEEWSISYGVHSAFSLMPPLAQLALASVGETQDEILNAIGLKNENITKEVFKMVNNRFRSIKGITLEMANRVYIREDRELNQDFAKLSAEVFNSDFKNVDFRKSVETAQEINSWVEDQTNQRIKNVTFSRMLRLDDSTEAVLINALYIKGKWKEQFLPENTHVMDFHANKNITIPLPMMHKRCITCLYAESQELNAKLLEVFFEGDEASFLVVLPNEVDGLPALEAKLMDPAALTKATEALSKSQVDVYLPKINMKSVVNLRLILQKYGITKLFTSGKARLENLLKGTSNMYVSSAIQMTIIELDEESAKAAAANEAVVTEPPEKIRDFKANHPFVFLLLKDRTVLFAGDFKLEGAL